MTRRLRPTARPFAVVLALLLALPALLAASEGADPARHACRSRAGVIGDATWTIVPIPAFPSGEAQPRRHASHPQRPGVHFVTNGTSIQRTLDGGCTWTEVFTLPTGPTLEAPFSSATGRIVDVVVPRSAGHPGRVYVLVLDLAQGGLTGAATDPPTVAHLLRSDASGEPGSYRKVDQGMQPVGRSRGGEITGCGPLSGCILEVAPTDANVLYLALSPDPSGPGTLQRSTDGGVTWVALNPPVGSESVQGIEQLAVNPAVPTDVWVDHGGVFRSPNGGGQWSAEPDGLTGFRPVLDVASAGVGARVLTISSSERRQPGPVAGVAVRPAGATAFTSLRPSDVDLHGVRVESATSGATPSDIVLAASEAVLAYHPGTDTFVDVDPRGHAATYGPLRNAQTVFGRSAGVAHTFLGTGVLAIYTGPTGAGLVEAPPALQVPPLQPPPPPPVEPVRIEPAGAVIQVEPETTEVVDVVVDLPAPPRVVDVFFLMDTSISMEKTIDGLAVGLAEVARRVAEAGVDAHFGLAEFQDSDGPARGRRYRRRVDVSRPSPVLQKELGDIRTQGGNEPHLTAMDQMATGAGLLSPSRGLGVEPGQGASWRDGSIRLAIMLTNEPYGRDASPTTTDATDGNHPDPDGPSYATVLRHLAEDEIRVVGVRVVQPEQQVGLGDTINEASQKVQENEARRAIAAATLEDLRRWASDTDAVAPTGGIDCDADGDVDLPAGAPLVCSVFEEESAQVNDLTAPLVRLILSLADVAPVNLTATVESRVGPGLTVEVTAGGDYSAVNLGADQRLPFGMTVGCSPEEAGRAFRVRLDALVDGAVAASSPVTVACGSLPEGEVPAPEPPAARVVPPAAPPAPPPAPINAPVPAGAPAPAAAAVSAAAPAAAPGFAPPPAVFDGGPAEVQVRLANEARARRGRMLFATSRREPEVPPIAVTLLGAVGLTAIASFVALRGPGSAPPAAARTSGRTDRRRRRRRRR